MPKEDVEKHDLESDIKDVNISEMQPETVTSDHQQITQWNPLGIFNILIQAHTKIHL